MFSSPSTARAYIADVRLFMCACVCQLYYAIAYIFCVRGRVCSFYVLVNENSVCRTSLDFSGKLFFATTPLPIGYK